MKYRHLIVVATALLIAPAVVAQTTFTVTVAPKSAAHPLFGQGHPDAFVIDGIEANALTLIRGETYIFQMDNTPGFHPFYISTDDTGAGLGEWTDGVTGSGAAGNDALTFVVPSGAPDELFYQCFNHQFMGWELNIVDPVDVTCTPMNPPIVIPAGGGLYLFDLQIVNYTASSAIFDIWLNVDGPGGGVERGPVTKLLAPGDTLFRTLAQNMPASQPAGAYTQTCSVGTYPIADASSSFDFTKSAVFAPGGMMVADWSTEADFATALASEAPAEMPTEIGLEANYPNPFNPHTTIRFGLPESAQVRLVVYDVLGRLVRVLVDGLREAGMHEVVFDAGDLPSGTYLYRLETPQGSFVRTMLLAK